MRKFFNIKTAYQFEMGDVYALIQVVSVALLIKFGLVASWFGLGVSVWNIANDVRNPARHLNDFILHGAIVVLNIYFLSLFYFGA